MNEIKIIYIFHFRGKCSVTLYSEVEHLLEYVREDDWFYYLLVYDPQQKTLLADRGEIGVGDEYQADEQPQAIDSKEYYFIKNICGIHQKRLNL